MAYRANHSHRAGRSDFLRRNSTSNRRSDDAKRSEHYQLIGKTLRICEVASFRIGIPWLPPTRSVLARRRAFNQSLSDFLRTSLVHVPTSTLESYCDDLQTWPVDDESGYSLSIAPVSPGERYALPVVVAAGFAFGVFILSLVEGARSTLSLVLATIFSASLCLFSAMLCSEGYRRASFSWLISNEILRRRGDDLGPTSKIPLYPVEAESLKMGS